MIWSIFFIGAAVYGAFVLWYFNWKGPLRATEIETILTNLENHPALENTKLEVLRAFMEADDGREFCMTNHARLRKGIVSDPISGASSNAETLIRAYMKRLMKMLLRRGCHPVYQANRVGGFVDSWGSDDKMDFPVVGMFRYRSRRDLVEIISGSTAPEGLKIKQSAIEHTISVPIQIKVSLFMHPKYAVPLLILLICCLVQIGVSAI